MRDVTEHPTDQGKIYLATVLDTFSQRVVGWSIADHIRSELVVDAVQMAIWRRNPPPGQTIAHSDHGSTYTSWAVGRRLRYANLLGSMGSMGSIGDCFDNSVAESFFGTLQLELLDARRWATREELAAAIFEWIECWYNPHRRHSYCGMLSPSTRNMSPPPEPRHDHLNPTCPVSRGSSGTVRLYALDWDTTARRETVTVNDGTGPQTATLSDSSTPGHGSPSPSA